MARAGLRLSAAAAAMACVGMLSLALQPGRGAFVPGATPVVHNAIGAPAAARAFRASAPAPAAGSSIDVARCGVCAALLICASAASTTLRRSQRPSRTGLRSCAVSLNAQPQISFAPPALELRPAVVESVASDDLLDLGESVPVVAPISFVISEPAIAAEPSLKNLRGVEARFIGGSRRSNSRGQSRGSERTARRAVGAKLMEPTCAEVPRPSFDMSKIRMKIQSSLCVPSSVPVQRGREASTPSTAQTSEMTLGLRIQANKRE